jgi:hypothetical protein
MLLLVKAAPSANRACAWLAMMFCSTFGNNDSEEQQ